MFLSLVLTGLLIGPATPPATTLATAAELARNGQYQEALEAFRLLASANPRDQEARLWIARLHVWMRHPELAEPVYRSVLHEDPSNIEAMIGVGSTLVRVGRADEAIELLESAERVAPQNADVLAELGRAHRSAGHTSLSLGYLQRAVAIAPTLDNRMSLEQTRLQYAHRIENRTFFEHFDSIYPDSRSTEFGVNVRLDDRWRLSGRGQVQRKFGRTEQRGGIGGEWRWSGATTLTAHAFVGPGNQVLPTSDTGLEIDHTRGNAAWSLGYRLFDFRGATVSVMSPGVVWWPGDRLSFGVRYYVAFTDFDNFGVVEHGHTGMLRGSYRLHPRVWADLGYTRGVNSFDTLSPDQLGDFRANTTTGGLRFELPSLTSVIGTYEHQSRRNGVEAGRFTISLAQRF